MESDSIIVSVMESFKEDDRATNDQLEPLFLMVDDMLIISIHSSEFSVSARRLGLFLMVLITETELVCWCLNYSASH